MTTTTITRGSNGGAAAGAEVRASLDEIADETARELRAQQLLEHQTSIALRSRFLADAIANDDQAITVAMIGRELGIPVMTALREIHLIPARDGKFKPAISSQLKHALAIRRVPGFALEVIELSDKICVVQATRPGREARRFAWSIENSRIARLLEPTRSGADSNHVKFPQQMFLARAISIAVDAVAPEATMGIQSAEEARDDVHLEQLAHFPAVGSSSGRDSAPGNASPAPAAKLRTLAELEAIAIDCADDSDVARFRELYRADRLALSPNDRERLASTIARRLAELGIKSRADATKAAAQAAASPATSVEVSPTPPAPPAKPATKPRGPAKATTAAAPVGDDHERNELAMRGEIARARMATIVDERVRITSSPAFARLSDAARARINNAAESRQLELEAEAEGSRREEPGTADAEPDGDDEGRGS